MTGDGSSGLGSPLPATHRSQTENRTQDSPIMNIQDHTPPGGAHLMTKSPNGKPEDAPVEYRFSASTKAMN